MVKKKKEVLTVIVTRPFLQSEDGAPVQMEIGEEVTLPIEVATRLCNRSIPRAMPYETPEQIEAADTYLRGKERPAAKPKRKRRTKEEIEADKAAEKAAKDAEKGS